MVKQKGGEEKECVEEMQTEKTVEGQNEKGKGE